MARRPLKDPPVRACDWQDSHRLIPSRASETGTVLSALADGEKELDELVLLEGATNERVQSEQRGAIGISTFEFVYGIPNAHIVNAAYAHSGEWGARFSDRTRGAWYAGESQAASIAEVTYHKSRRLAEIIVPNGHHERPRGDVSTYDDWLADFKAHFHVLEPPEVFAAALRPEPVPQCYASSQALAQRLLSAGSNGIVYPSVRLHGARCLVCFRPALVYNPHWRERLEITFTATESGYDATVRRVEILAE